MDPIDLFYASDTNIWMEGLTSDITDQFINNATATFAVKNESEVVVATGLAMSYIAASNGNYVGVFPAATALNITVGYRYTVEISYSSASGSGLIRVPAECVYQGQVPR